LTKLSSAEEEKLIMDSFWDDAAAGIPSSDAMVAEEDAVSGSKYEITLASLYRS
jgi:hypothetical protein